MSPLRSVTLIFVLLYACSSIQSARGLKCYVCDNCAFPGHPGDTPQLQDCEPTEPGDGGCISITEYVRDDVNKPYNVDRYCNIPDSTAEKQELMKCKVRDQTENEKASTRCFCETDGCNQNGCSCDRSGGGGAKSSGSNIGVFSLWPLAALNLLLIHLEMALSSSA